MTKKKYIYQKIASPKLFFFYLSIYTVLYTVSQNIKLN